MVQIYPTVAASLQPDSGIQLRTGVQHKYLAISWLADNMHHRSLKICLLMVFLSKMQILKIHPYILEYLVLQTKSYVKSTMTLPAVTNICNSTTATTIMTTIQVCATWYFQLRTAGFYQTFYC